MNKEKYDSLNSADKLLVNEAYLDGFNAAIKSVESSIQHSGDLMIDKMFISNRDWILYILNHSYEKMKESCNE